MKICCGSCQQFVRQPAQEKDLCSAWGNPTSMERQACDYWMPKGRLYKESAPSKSTKP